MTIDFFHRFLTSIIDVIGDVIVILDAFHGVVQIIVLLLLLNDHCRHRRPRRRRRCCSSGGGGRCRGAGGLGRPSDQWPHHRRLCGPCDRLDEGPQRGRGHQAAHAGGVEVAAAGEVEPGEEKVFEFCPLK